MNSIRLIRAVLTACIIACASPGASALNKSTDNSDLWWVSTESGWNVTLIQDNNTIYAVLFVYGPDNQPNWYTGLMASQGGGTWSGALYKTTGPWFGNVPFDPQGVTIGPVGTISVSFPSINAGNLIYTINGVSVIKTIERFLLAYEDFSGTYAGVLGQQNTGTGCNPADNFDSTPTTIVITQSTTAMTIVMTAQGDTCTYPGVYSQTGHFGRFRGNYLCTSGASGTFDFTEMVRTHADIRARSSNTRGPTCTIKGRLVGLEQPLPPQ